MTSSELLTNQAEQELDRFRIEEFKLWFKKELAKGHNVSVDIKMQTERHGGVNIWVYSYDLQVGQYVESADEINLEGKAEEAERKEYDRLRQKYGAV
ncbi:MAG: hypothetical protein DDT19_02540 [Syntrophomonadaceae bacterium]|nr:hypothetical protein [Bacillota bacterium]